MKQTSGFKASSPSTNQKSCRPFFAVTFVRHSRIQRPPIDSHRMKPCSQLSAILAWTEVLTFNALHVPVPMLMHMGYRYSSLGQRYVRHLLCLRRTHRCGRRHDGSEPCRHSGRCSAQPRSASSCWRKRRRRDGAQVSLPSNLSSL